MEDLVTWLRQQLDEDERVARAVKPLRRVPVMGGPMGETFSFRRLVPASEDGVYQANSDPAAQAHFARHDPARVLREVESTRTIVDEYDRATALYPADGRSYDWDSEHGRTRTAVLAECVRILALPYAERPGYQESWRP